MSVSLVWKRPKPGGSSGDTNSRTATSTISLDYLVMVSGITNNPNEIRQLRSIAKEGSAFGGGTLAVCTHVRADRDDDQPKLWHVTERYEGPADSETGSSGTAKEIQEALMEPIQVRTDSDEIMVPFEKAYDNNDQLTIDVVNSCYMQFSPLPEKMDGISWIEFQRNEQDMGTISAASWRYTVNSDSFMGVRPRCSLLRRAGARLVWTKNQQGWWWRSTYLFCFKRDGWDVVLMDRGFYHKKTFTSDSGKTAVMPGQFDRNVDSNGVPYVEPQRLDGKGHLLVPGEKSVFGEFKAYRKRPHSALGLPQWRIIL